MKVKDFTSDVIWPSLRGKSQSLMCCVGQIWDGQEESFFFLQHVFLLMDFKRFNVRFSPLPTRGSGKRGYGRSGPVYKGSLEQLASVLSGNQQLSWQVSSGSLIHLQTIQF